MHAFVCINTTKNEAFVYYTKEAYAYVLASLARIQVLLQLGLKCTDKRKPNSITMH